MADPPTVGTVKPILNKYFTGVPPDFGRILRSPQVIKGEIGPLQPEAATLSTGKIDAASYVDRSVIL